MRLKIAPGSLWLAYTARRLDVLKTMIPDEVQLTTHPLWHDQHDFPRVPLLFNAYRLQSTYMNGHRIEVQVLTQHRTTGKMHLVVLDCVSDTLMWDPCNGIQLPNAPSVTTLGQTSQTYRFEMPKTLFVRD